MSSAFRQTFTHGIKDFSVWFPGHMNLGMKQMQQKLKLVDCIIEVHDARIPFSGRNPNFYHLLTAVRPHVLVLNKMDLSDLKNKNMLVDKIKRDSRIDEVIFTNCKKQRGVRKILPKCLELIQKSDRYNRTNEENILLMVIGVPNVGKSSLINQLRSLNMQKAKATRVGASPGVTRSVLEKIKINENPPVYLLDTPGVLAPNIKDLETGLKLALCATIKDHLVGEDIMADYLLYWLNKNNNFSYVDFLKLSEPCDNIQKVLLQVAVNLGKTFRHRSLDGVITVRPNLFGAAAYMISSFRSGHFGLINLDEFVLS